MTEPLTCGTCRHWQRQPADPLNLGAPARGTCREHLHSAVVGMAADGPVITAYYPVTLAVMPACGRYNAPAVVSLGGSA